MEKKQTLHYYQMHSARVGEQIDTISGVSGQSRDTVPEAQHSIVVEFSHS